MLACHKVIKTRCCSFPGSTSTNTSSLFVLHIDASWQGNDPGKHFLRLAHAMNNEYSNIFLSWQQQARLMHCWTQSFLRIAFTISRITLSKSYYEQRYEQAKAHYRLSEMLSKVLSGQTWTDRLFRKVLMNLPQWVQQAEYAKSAEYRPQIMFLPQIENRGTIPALPQKPCKRYVEECRDGKAKTEEQGWVESSWRSDSLMMVCQNKH